MERNVEIVTDSKGKKLVRINDIRQNMVGIGMTQDLNYRYIVNQEKLKDIIFFGQLY